MYTRKIYSLILICSFFVLQSSSFTLDKSHNSIHNIKYNNEPAGSSGNLTKDHRLPHTITPVSYVIKFIPYFELRNFIFYGETSINFIMNENNNTIVLNSVGLNFDERNVTVNQVASGENVKIEVSKVEFDNETEQVVISTNQNLEKGKSYEVTINYFGFLSEMMDGFYRSWYLKDDEIRWTGATQLEAPYARKTFPCLDEPQYRASFNIQIARLNDMKTVSNMPLNRTSDPDPSIENRVWDIYQSTPDMATYLVAFCVFDFKPSSRNNVTVWTQASDTDQVVYILNNTQEIMDFLGEFTAINYTLPKMDLVAVPDFNVGAMENWGLNTYRDIFLLYKPNISTAFNKQRVLSVVAHEFSHQWFGNLVTPSWWDYLWLNEAFATFFEYYIPSVIEPSWRVMEQFVTHELQHAFSEDAGQNHPMNAKVNTKTEVEAIFDTIEYSKGASVLRMLQHFIGDEYFMKSLQYYLKESISSQHGTVVPNNLWDAFNKVVPADKLPQDTTIQQVMTTWTDQKGFPLVTVTRGYQNKSAIITQKEFFSENPENSTSQWWVPFTCTDSDELNFNASDIIWLKPNISTNIEVRTEKWILCNVKQKGYYRVNYDEQNWDYLIEQLMENHSVIDPLNRAQIIDDAFALAEAGIIKYDIPIALCRYLIYETDFIPWSAATHALENIFEKLFFTTSASILKAFTQNLVRPIYNLLMTIPLENQTHVDKLHIAQILSFACKINLYDCETQLTAAFNDWILKITSLNLVPDVKEAVLCTGVKLGTKQSWDTVWQFYQQSEIPSERVVVLQALGCSTNADILENYMSLLLTQTKPPYDVRDQDYKALFNSVTAQPRNTGTALKFVINNFESLHNVPKIPIAKSMFENLGDYINNKDEYDELQMFYNDNIDKLGDLNSTVNETLTGIKARLDWTDKNAEYIEQCLYALTPTETETKTN